MMSKAFSLACSAALLLATTSAAADTAPDTPGESSTRAFTVDLGAVASPADAIQAIVDAGHAQLVTACEGMPGAAVRIFNPLASGDFADVTCADILGIEPATSTSVARSSEPGGERIGGARQPITPVGLACGILTGILAAATAHSCEYHPDDICPWGTLGGNMTVGFICMFL